MSASPIFTCRPRRLGAGLVLLLGAAACAAQAGVWVPRLQQYVGPPGAHLGTSIALGEGLDAQGHCCIISRVYVGEPDGSGPSGELQAGEVQVFDPGPGGWVSAGTLYSISPQAGAHFGAALGSSAGHLVVGAPDYDDAGGVGAGAGRVEFYFDNGSTPLDLGFRGFRNGTGGHFGSAIAVDVDMAAVGKTQNADGSGCVSVFHYELNNANWHNLPAVNDIVCGSAGAALGSSVAIRRTSNSAFVLVAGAPGESQGANALAGAVHVYIPNPDQVTGGFFEVGTLSADTPLAFDFFGTSVGIDADFLYVGATGRDNGVGRVGSVTIFRRVSLISYDYMNEYFPSPPATIGGHCGASLSIDAVNKQFIMGCPDSASPYYAHEGTARVYRQLPFLGTTVWLDSVLGFGTQPHNGNDALGASVALFGDMAVVGAPDAHVTGQAGNGGWKTFVPDAIYGNGFEP